MFTWNQLNFQNSFSPSMLKINMLHDKNMIILILITVLVMCCFVFIARNKKIASFFIENNQLEIIWTCLPTVFLVFIAGPSIQTIYLTEEVSDSSISMKTVGHQWYWTYEFPNFNNISIDSFMDKSFNCWRTLDVDVRLTLPISQKIKMFVSSDDVLHSWTIPALGVKTDANPGRLNQIILFSSKPGLFFGQCSELCGPNHSFMPSVLQFVNVNLFKTHITQFYCF